MTELIQFMIGGAIVLAVGYAGFLMGRDSGERQAFYTISELRRQVRALNLDLDRMRQRLNAIPRGDAQQIRTDPDRLTAEAKWMWS